MSKQPKKIQKKKIRERKRFKKHSEEEIFLKKKLTKEMPHSQERPHFQKMPHFQKKPHFQKMTHFQKLLVGNIRLDVIKKSQAIMNIVIKGADSRLPWICTLRENQFPQD